MRFCPKCGGSMVPAKQGGEDVMRCMRCGYVEKATLEALSQYKSVSKPDAKVKVHSTRVVAQARRQASTKEEIEQAKDSYYELVLEQMGEYGD